MADPSGRVLSAPGSPAGERNESLHKAVQYLLTLQREDGAWEGEVVWCTMILSQYVIVRHAAARPIDEGVGRQIVRHYQTTRTSEGGWALHPEGRAQVFTTTLAYVALRLLGVAPDDGLVAPAREWLQRQAGGVLGIPTWGKFWLAILDLYEYEGVSALPPELFLAPAWVPFHPRRWYCHTRYIYLGMAYLYGRRFRADLGPLRDALRHELYEVAYGRIDFGAYRYHISPTDLHAKPPFVTSVIRRLLAPLAAISMPRLRARALNFCFERILYEQRITGYQALSPVNGLLNCLAILATDPGHPELQASLDGLEAWRWSDDAEGIRYAGARSQVWDTAFAARALLAAAQRGTSLDTDAVSFIDVEVQSLRRAYHYLERAQLTEELPDRAREHREAVRGGWCFSDGRHRWPVCDCTAEALTTMLKLEAVPNLIAERLPSERVRDAVRFLLARQNSDGGFSTYEAARAGSWLDDLNPSEMFRACMTERSYVECTASALEALAAVRAAYPHLLQGEIATAVSRSAAFLRRRQQTDGAFEAAWGINFSYGIFHVAKALRAAGADSGDAALVRAAAWLQEKQRADGGWGEHFSSALTGSYVEHPRSQTVMTSWALLALAECARSSPATNAGRRWLESVQQPDGSWPREAVNGVFFGTAMLDYRLYRAYFPLWALARTRAGSPCEPKAPEEP